MLFAYVMVSDLCGIYFHELNIHTEGNIVLTRGWNERWERGAVEGSMPSASVLCPREKVFAILRERL